jgi:hypothetical protein
MRDQTRVIEEDENSSQNGVEVDEMESFPITRSRRV